MYTPFWRNLLFWKYAKADYSACFYEKLMLKKKINKIREIQETKYCICACEFSWFTKKVVCTTPGVPHTTFLEYRPLFQVLFLLRIFFKVTSAKWQKFTYNYIPLMPNYGVVSYMSQNSAAFWKLSCEQWCQIWVQL